MKKIIGIAFIVVATLTTGWTFSQSQKNMELSDLVLANVEALARGEWGDKHCDGCLKDFTKVCWLDEVDGCLGQRLIEVR